MNQNLGNLGITEKLGDGVYPNMTASQAATISSGSHTFLTTCTMATRLAAGMRAGAPLMPCFSRSVHPRGLSGFASQSTFAHRVTSSPIRFVSSSLQRPARPPATCSSIMLKISSSSSRPPSQVMSLLRRTFSSSPRGLIRQTYYSRGSGGGGYGQGGGGGPSWFTRLKWRLDRIPEMQFVRLPHQ